MAAIPADQLPLLEQQIEGMFGIPMWLALFGALERVFALLLHLAASLLVMQVFVRGQRRWLLAAIGWHALIDGVLVYVFALWGAVWAEVVLGGMSRSLAWPLFSCCARRSQLAVPIEPCENFSRSI